MFDIKLLILFTILNCILSSSSFYNYMDSTQHKDFAISEFLKYANFSISQFDKDHSPTDWKDSYGWIFLKRELNLPNFNIIEYLLNLTDDSIISENNYIKIEKHRAIKFTFSFDTEYGFKYLPKGFFTFSSDIFTFHKLYFTKNGGLMWFLL
jgi:hypothetical protein